MKYILFIAAASLCASPALAAPTPISALPAATTLTGPEVAPVVQSWFSGPPGANREEESVEYPSIAVDRSTVIPVKR